MWVKRYVLFHRKRHPHLAVAADYSGALSRPNPQRAEVSEKGQRAGAVDVTAPR